MRAIRCSLSLFLAFVAPSAAYLLGPVYPAPRDLSSNSSRVLAAWNNLTSILEVGLRSNQSADSSQDALFQLRELTFSAGMFSIQDPAAQSFQFHHTSPEILSAPAGTNEVDGDSIYRVASVSKLVTVLAGLLAMNDSDWERPLTDIFPELSVFVRDHPDPALHVQWDEVTPRALAAQMAGIQSGGIFLSDVFLQGEAAALELGLPPPPDINDLSNLPPCFFTSFENLPVCSPDQWAEIMSSDAPLFSPWTSPSYSNNGFVLLGLVIAKLTGQSMQQIYNDRIFTPLDMASSSSLPPANGSDLSRYVIAGDPSAFIGDNGILNPSGGIFSSINDLARMGEGILNSTLLTPVQTRRWMKPLSHTASLQYSTGSPWEIYRYTHATSGVVTDIYTKLGDSGPWGGLLALIPDFDVGFSILSTSAQIQLKSNGTRLVADMITESILPALMDQAACEAERNFAGSYSSTTEGLNSSLTLAVDLMDNSPGLSITSWNSNGTDLMPVLAAILGNANSRLVPTIPDSTASGRTAFRPYTVPFNPTAGLFANFLDVGDWVTAGSLSTYNGTGLSHFVFETELDTGNAVAVTPLTYGARLERD